MKLQDITKDNDIINHLPAGQFLQAWLREDEQMALIPDFGWLDGGCRILAEALIEIIPDAKLKVVGSEGQTTPSEHVVVEVMTNAGATYLDGDGICTERELLEKMRAVEAVDAPWIGDYDAGHLDSRGILADIKASAALSQRLREHPLAAKGFSLLNSRSLYNRQSRTPAIK